METLQDLFLETLKDIYYAEKAILKALPKMAKKATSEDLATAFETHRDETEQQVTRRKSSASSTSRRAARSAPP
jgi:ferritin-like metal-binding protein YciE